MSSDDLVGHALFIAMKAHGFHACMKDEERHTRTSPSELDFMHSSSYLTRAAHDDSGCWLRIEDAEPRLVARREAGARDVHPAVCHRARETHVLHWVRTAGAGAAAVVPWAVERPFILPITQMGPHGARECQDQSRFTKEAEADAPCSWTHKPQHTQACWWRLQEDALTLFCCAALFAEGEARSPGVTCAMQGVIFTEGAPMQGRW